MRIAAGVLLIISALVNGCVGSCAATAGGCAGVLGSAVEDANEASLEGFDEMARQAGEDGALDPDALAVKRDLEDATKHASDAKRVGGVWMLLGLFYMLLLGLQIAAAACCFSAKAEGFIKVVAVLTVLAEVSRLSTHGLVIWINLIGLLAGLFAFLAAKQMTDARLAEAD